MIDSNIQLPDKTFAGYNRRQVNNISLSASFSTGITVTLTFFRLKWSAFNCSWISCSCRMACGCTLCRNPSRTPLNVNFFIFLTWVDLPLCLLHAYCYRYCYRYRYQYWCWEYSKDNGPIEKSGYREMGGGVSRADNSVWLIFYFRSVVSRFYQFNSSSSSVCSSCAFSLIYNIRLLGFACCSSGWVWEVKLG